MFTPAPMVVSPMYERWGTLEPLADGGFLDFDMRAHMGAVEQVRAGPQIGARPHGDLVLDDDIDANGFVKRAAVAAGHNW